MSQDGFKSAVFRSFVKCNDPKGVAEYKTMRKSKTKAITNDFTHSPANTGKGKQIAFKPSSLQLNEVSKEAINLNQAIDTYSNGGMRFDHYSKEIAKDLLKGALDLQESLMVLGKLQEASHYMSKFRKKPKDEKNDEKIRIQKSKSERYVDYNYQKGFQKPRASVDDSSRDCYDELRTVIRDSLARQNLLPPNFHEKPNFSNRKLLDSMVDIPSTSSTQSSTMNFISFTSSDTSCSSDSTKRSKGSNVIAKLMGLDEIDSQQRFASSPKRFEIEKFPGQRRHVFDVDVANVKKVHSGTYKEDNEEKKLRNIVETMRYKGLLKGKTNSNDKNSKKILIEGGPPIVIMKPMDASSEEQDENYSQKLVRKTNERDLNRGAVDFDEVCRRLRGEVSPTRKPGFREFKEKELSNKLKVLGSKDQKDNKKKLEKMDKSSKAEHLKSKSGSKSLDEQKVSSTRERKEETGTNSRKRSVSPQKSSNPVINLNNKSPFSRKGGDRKKNLKIVKELVIDPSVEGDVEHNLEEEQIDQSSEDVRDKASTSITTTAQVLAEEEIKAPINEFKDQPKNTKLESIAESDEEASFFSSHNIIPQNKCFSKQTKESKLFLSTPSFLNYAEELFGIETNSQTTQLLSPNDLQISDTRLLLEVANDFMLQKKLSTQLIHPPFLSPSTLKTSLSLTQLVDEVCKGLDDLSKYSENGNKKLIAETLYSVLERDMLGRGLANGAWELGWRHGYGFDDVEQVVGDIENRVLNELIDDMLLDSLLVF